MTEGNPFDVEGVWLKSAFHTHTSRSDGELDPAAHVRHHEWAGFDVCTITDHWTLTHQPSTKHCLVITGAELATDPYGEAWMIVVKLADPTLVDSLLDAVAYEALVAGEAK